jgi:hypothetical protein
MSDVSTLAAVLEATTVSQEAPELEAPEQEEKQLNTLLRKAESAFTKGNKGLLLSRVECGRWCHAVYVLRAAQGHKDRSFTSQLIFNRLAVHADSRRECDVSELAKLFKTVELLAPEGNDGWKALTVGKLYDMTPLVVRTDGSEVYAIFDVAKTEQAKALFAWACGDGISKPSREDIHNRVLELTDPTKYAEKVEKEQRKAAEKAEQGAEESAKDEEAPEAPTNLIPTDANPSRARLEGCTRWNGRAVSRGMQATAGSFLRHDARFCQAIRLDKRHGQGIDRRDCGQQGWRSSGKSAANPCGCNRGRVFNLPGCRTSRGSVARSPR